MLCLAFMTCSTLQKMSNDDALHFYEMIHKKQIATISLHVSNYTDGLLKRRL